MKSILILFLIFQLGLSVFANTRDASSKVSFEEILSIAVSKSEDVKAKESELRSAESLRTQSVFQFSPDLNLVGTYSEIGSEAQSTEPRSAYEIRSRMNLFRFGADYYSFKSNDLLSQSAKWDLQNSRLKWEEEIASKILEVIYRQNETLIRKKLYDSQRHYTGIAEKRFSKGILPRQELDKHKIDMGIAEARLRDAEILEFQARENLKVYTGDISFKEEWPWTQTLKKRSRIRQNFQLQDHPQWNYLNQQFKAAEYQTKQRKSEMWPSLDLSLSYLNESSVVTNNEWTDQWVGALTLTIPLFSQFESSTISKLDFENQNRAELKFRKGSREIEANWRSAEKDFTVHLESAQNRELNLKISSSLYRDNFQRFQSGRSNANDLFNDQDRLYQTELLANQGWYSVHISFIKLCHSVGVLLEDCQKN